jgi:hypothetical protein
VLPVQAVLFQAVEASPPPHCANVWHSQ